MPLIAKRQAIEAILSRAAKCENRHSRFDVVRNKRKVGMQKICLEVVVFDAPAQAGKPKVCEE
jgi:hypothetical protein